MKRGDQGRRVRKLQRALVADGCELPDFGVDGDFGGETCDALDEWCITHDRERTLCRVGGELPAALVREILGEPQLGPVKSIATIWGPSRNLPGWDEEDRADDGDWIEGIRAFEAASWKVSDGRDRLEGHLDAMERADLVGCDRHTWSYMYGWTPERAAAEGRIAGKQACKASSVRHYCNAEQDWARCWKRTPAKLRADPKRAHWAETPHEPVEAAIAFSRVFRVDAPGCDLFWNGFGRGKGLSAEILAHYDGWSPMIYQTGRTFRRRWESLADYWSADELKTIGDLVVCPMVASGRITKDGRPTMIAEELLERIHSHPTPEVAVWLGTGSHEMLLKGNRKNPPWSQLAEDLTQLGGEEVSAWTL